jgi:hypothetical protein
LLQAKILMLEIAANRPSVPTLRLFNTSPSSFVVHKLARFRSNCCRVTGTIRLLCSFTSFYRTSGWEQTQSCVFVTRLSMLTGTGAPINRRTTHWSTREHGKIMLAIHRPLTGGSKFTHSLFLDRFVNGNPIRFVNSGSTFWKHFRMAKGNRQDT